MEEDDLGLNLNLIKLSLIGINLNFIEFDLNFIEPELGADIDGPPGDGDVSLEEEGAGAVMQPQTHHVEGQVRVVTPESQSSVSEDGGHGSAASTDTDPEDDDFIMFLRNLSEGDTQEYNRLKKKYERGESLDLDEIGILQLQSIIVRKEFLKKEKKLDHLQVRVDDLKKSLETVTEAVQNTVKNKAKEGQIGKRLTAIQDQLKGIKQLVFDKQIEAMRKEMSELVIKTKENAELCTRVAEMMIEEGERLEAKLDILISGQEVEEEKLACIVCMDLMPAVVLVPCSHNNLCRVCAEKICQEDKRCPIDRIPITGIIPLGVA